MPQIIAFSGSPIRNGNIEKGLAAVVDSSGLSAETIRLYDLDLKVCIGCKKCADTNRCAFKDDLNPVLEKIEEAEALVFSGYPSFGSVNAMTKVFIEKLWPLRHNHMLTTGKAGAAVICGLGPQDSLETYFARYFQEYLRADYLGALTLPGNAPCMTCGYGENCNYSGFLRQYGPGAKVTPDKFQDAARNETVLAEAHALGQALGEAVRNKTRALP
ncbi:MAG: flavodoxin family protein [Candidatus Adiutrix sp.]|jgi:multimeric flavodoxin WrbA|nr:flavodoxin family protein [Candidatus Adiutrix sp.]